MDKRKVLFFINSGLKNAGVPRIAVDIIEGLSDEFHFDLAIQCNHCYHFDAALIKKGCKIYYLGNPKQGRKGIFYNLIKRNLQIFNIIKNGHYEVVHSFTAYQSGLDCAMSALLGVKTRISNTHGVVKHSNKGITKLYERLCLILIRKFATHRIGVSVQAAESVYSSMPYQVICNSVDFRKYGSILPQSHKGINLLQIGYFNENKNQLFSLNILKLLLERELNAHLYFIGYENAEGYKNRMNDFIKDNNLIEKVTFLPHDYEKELILPYVDYILQPSHHEGFSLVALESQAAKIKCLASCAVPEEVNIGLLRRMEIDNIESWVNCINDNHFKMEIKEEKAKKFFRETFLHNFKVIYNY